MTLLETATKAKWTTEGRAALRRHLNALFGPTSRENQSFQRDILNWRTPAQRTALWRQMRREAEAWSPDPFSYGEDAREDLVQGWWTEIFPWGQLYTEIRWRGLKKAPTVFVEID